MKPLRSIRWRILGWYGLLLTLILTVLGVMVFQHENALRERSVDWELESRLNIMAHSVKPLGKQGSRQQSQSHDTSDKDDDKTLPQDVSNKDNNKPPPPPQPKEEGAGLQLGKIVQLSSKDAPLFEGKGGFYYAVWLFNGPKFTASANAPPDIPRRPAGESGIRTRGNLREACIFPAPGDCILVGVPMENSIPGMTHFAWMLTGGGVFILGGGLLVGWWLITLALRPVQSITAAAARISSGDLSQRVSVTETESELGGLALVLNRTFERLETVFAQQERFTADAAHELRTPVTVILTHVQNGLAIADNNEEQREAFEACQRAAQRMRNLIESLLQLARFQAGEEELRRIPCDLAMIAEEAVGLVQPLAKSHHVVIRLDTHPTPLRADPDQLNQVLTNLLTNAIYYGKESGEIEVVTRVEKGAVWFSVSDNGPGISPEDIPRIFDRFSRVEKARTTRNGHTGLGLAICKAIVKAHKGTIEAQSIPGQKTIFTVRLPDA